MVQLIARRFGSFLPLWAMVATALLMTLAGAPVVANDQLAARSTGPVIALKVDQVRNGDGWITVMLYNDRAEDFLDRAGRVKKVRVAAEAGATEVTLEAPQAGVYAIVLYHDENANTDMDKNFIGYPLEGYGFSNNPTLFLAPPTHDEVAFTVDPDGATLEIKVTYP